MSGPLPPVPFVPIERGMIDGSLWEADLRVRVLFVTMLFVSFEPARRGTVDLTLRKLAGRAGMSPEDVRYALDVLMAPDPESRTPDDDGRRIERLSMKRDWGWRIVNWEAKERLRQLMLNAARQARFKAKKVVESNAPVTASNAQVTHGNYEGEGEVEDEGEDEKKSRGASAPPRPPSRARFAPPTEDEWLTYCSKTWPDWTRHDVLAAHGHYEAKGWAKVKSWKGCAKTCYHTQAGRPAPRNGQPAPALIGAHKQEIPTRDIGDAPDDIREIHARLRRREATDDEVARLDEWVHGGAH